jgi:ribose transport system permease protein
MSIDVPERAPETGQARGHRLRAWLLKVFLRVGVLPFLLVIAVVVFSVLSDQFLTAQNLINLIRQSVYLILVSMGQMLALATGGFDLSVGTIVALTSVVSASVMSTMGADGGSAAWAVLLGCGAGLAAGSTVGLVNGLGIALGSVSPFIMTLGVQSIGLGVALALTGGVPVSGIPSAFGDLFGFGTLLGMPIPVIVTAVIVVAM